MKIVLAGFGVFLALMTSGIVAARVVSVEFDGSGFAALFFVSALAGACAAAATAEFDRSRDR